KHAEKLRVDCLAGGRAVTMPEHESRHFAGGERQGSRMKIHSLEQGRSRRLGIDAIARRGDEALAFGEASHEIAQAAVGKDEVCIEENQPGVRHRRAKVAEASVQDVGQRYSILVRRWNEVIQLDQANLAELFDLADRGVGQKPRLLASG